MLADLGKTSSDFRQLTTKALDQLCGGLMPRLRPVLDEAAAASYELGEADLGAPSPWPHALLRAFQAHLGWLQPLLTPSGHDALVHLVLDKVGGWGGWVSVSSFVHPGLGCSRQCVHLVWDKVQRVGGWGRVAGSSQDTLVPLPSNRPPRQAPMLCKLPCILHDLPVICAPALPGGGAPGGGAEPEALHPAGRPAAGEGRAPAGR